MGRGRIRPLVSDAISEVYGYMRNTADSLNFNLRLSLKKLKELMGASPFLPVRHRIKKSVRKAQTFDTQRPIVDMGVEEHAWEGLSIDNFFQHAHNKCEYAKVISGL